MDTSEIQSYFPNASLVNEYMDDDHRRIIVLTDVSTDIRNLNKIRSRLNIDIQMENHHLLLKEKKSIPSTPSILSTILPLSVCIVSFVTAYFL